MNCIEGNGGTALLQHVTVRKLIKHYCIYKFSHLRHIYRAALISVKLYIKQNHAFFIWHFKLGCEELSYLHYFLIKTNNNPRNYFNKDKVEKIVAVP